VTFWTAAYALELAGPDLETIRFWGDVKYLGILLLPPAWLTFVLHYTERRHWLTARRMALLAVVPALTVVVLANGATRELFRWYPDLEPGRDIPSAVIGPLFWVHAVYTYGLLLLGGVLLLRSTWGAAPGYRRQGVVVAATGIVCFLGNIAYVLGLGPFRLVDVTPFALLVLGVVLPVLRAAAAARRGLPGRHPRLARRSGARCCCRTRRGWGRSAPATAPAPGRRSPRPSCPS